jgi:hypothetical protein
VRLHVGLITTSSSSHCVDAAPVQALAKPPGWQIERRRKRCALQHGVCLSLTFLIDAFIAV